MRIFRSLTKTNRTAPLLSLLRPTRQAWAARTVKSSSDGDGSSGKTGHHDLARGLVVEGLELLVQARGDVRRAPRPRSR
jgi:hypothetical protein